MSGIEAVTRALRELSETALATSAALGPEIEAAAALIGSTVKAGRTLFFCGNGGSAADAQHLATEYVVRYMRARRAVAAIALWEHRAAAWHSALLFTFFAFHAFLYQGLPPVGPIARYAAVVPAFYVGLVLFAEERRWAQPVILAASVAALVVQTAMVFGGYHLN